ncbi:MAG TPA: hypothetical protein VI197_09825 [Polyangiaceae bacterium]
MRSISSTLIGLSVAAGFWACSSTSEYETDPLQELDAVNAAGPASGGGPTTVTTTVNTVTGTMGAVSSVTSGTSSSTSAAATVGSTGNTATTGSTDGVGGNGNNGAGPTTGGAPCTDTPPDDRQTCATWAEWGECGAEWLADFCHLSCDRCPSDTSGAVSTSGGGASNAATNDGTVNTTGSSTTGPLGNDNPWGNVEGGQNGWASRYWDCCKPSCGWSGNSSNPVNSCDISDNDIGVNDMRRNGCEAGGDTYTCHTMAPWAYSTEVSFGFAAINGVSCGTCFHIQFTGTAGNGGNGPGAAALANKHMIVMATNIGGIQQGQFDLLIPGGGVGDFDGCTTQWNVGAEELGARFGGFLAACPGNDLNSRKSCVAQKCESVFGSRGLTELYNGCMWFVDWFQAADNPDFRYTQVDCPQELIQAAH